MFSLLSKDIPGNVAPWTKILHDQLFDLNS